jgi:hypothetical protein
MSAVAKTILVALVGVVACGGTEPPPPIVFAGFAGQYSGGTLDSFSVTATVRQNGDHFSGVWTAPNWNNATVAFSMENTVVSGTLSVPTCTWGITGHLENDTTYLNGQYWGATCGSDTHGTFYLHRQGQASP